MKKIILILLLLLVCGCSSTYKLEISNDSFKEEINIIVPNYNLSQEQNIDPESGSIIENDDQLLPFLEEKTLALFSSKTYYNKKIDYNGEQALVNLKYNYSEKNFNDSNVLNTCFDDFVFKKNSTYYLHLKGHFYCLYSDSIDIEVITKNKVINNNAEEVNGNRYIWHITNNNVDNVDILLEVNKGLSKASIIYVFFGVLLAFIIIFLVLIVNNRKNKNNSI